MDNQVSPDITIHVPLNGNELLEKVLKIINANKEITTLWQMTNNMAIVRLAKFGYTDHGPVHFQIVANIAIRIERILVKHHVEMSISKDFGLSNKFAELVVLLASLFHDLGMSIDREGHEEYSLFLANRLLHEILDFLPIEQRTIVISEVLHAIISHRSGGNPLTIEAGVVRVSDALDMTKGRSRIPFEAGRFNIHSVSHAAIENVEIKEGEEKPVQIYILMNNSTGLFQVDELLKSKLKGSGIEKYIEVKAYISKNTEKTLIKEFIIKDL